MNGGQVILGNELIISAKSVKKIYPPDILALDGFDFEMEKGEFISLIGPSGCGKTTFLKIIAGFEKMQQGEVLFGGEPIEGTDWRRGVVFQDGRLFPWTTVRENLLFGLKLRKIVKEKQIEAMKKWTNIMRVADVLDEYPQTLGHGTQQRVNIARVIMGDPEIMMYDEPINSLDWPTREYLQTEILKYWYETRKSVLFVTHNISEAVYLGQRVVVMTARPGRTKEIVDVNLPERRWELHRDDKKYLKLVEYTARLVDDELTKARRMEKEVGY
jgi:NitT/TauT family transport system ATP-binding protein